MTPDTVSHLTLPDQCDLLSLYDHHTLEPSDNLADLSWSSYQTITIVAWSLGVWAAEQVLPHWSVLPSARCLITVAGFSYPMYDPWGIPEAVFIETLEGLIDENRQHFNRRMCGGKRCKQLYEILSERPTVELCDELQAVYDSIIATEESETKLHPRLAWNLVIVGAHNQIFPAINLSTLWQALHVPTKLLSDGYHYLFGLWHSWRELWECLE